MKSLEEIMQHYSSQHTKPFTVRTHFIGVPLIIVSIQMLFSWFQFSLFGMNLSFAWILCACLIGYYLLLNLNLGLLAASALFILTYLAQKFAGNQINLLSFMLMLIFFVVGWVAQLIGHYHEGKKPALFDNIFDAIISPLYLVAEAKSMWFS